MGLHRVRLRREHVQTLTLCMGSPFSTQDVRHTAPLASGAAVVASCFWWHSTAAGAAARARYFPLAELGDELIVAVGVFLDAPSLHSLALVSRRFARKAAPLVQHGVIVESLSLVQEAARLQWSLHSAEQRGQVPWLGHEQWLQLLRRIEVLSAPLAFHRSYRGGDPLQLSDDRRTMTKATSEASSGLLDAVLVFSEDDTIEPAIPMRRGRHFVEFSAVGPGSPAGSAHFSVGIVDHSSVRPSRSPSDSPSGRGQLEPPSGGGRARDASAYLYDTKQGQCLDWTGVDWARHSWKMAAGSWPAARSGSSDRIGLLLDVDAGTLSVYKNGAELGTMVSDLNKQAIYVWVVQIRRVGDSVRVHGPRASPPPSCCSRN